jgi:TonB family protein
MRGSHIVRHLFVLVLAISPAAAAEGQSQTCASALVAEGCGTYVWPDGSRYVGGFHEGFFDGQGVLSYADGSVLESHFRKGSVDGAAVYTTQAGVRIAGQIQDGTRDPARAYPLPDFPFWRGVFGSEASIQVSVTVAEDGRILSAKIDTPSKYDSFNVSAVDTIKQWVYRPATIDGKPVKTIGVIVVRFAQPGSPLSRAS